MSWIQKSVKMEKERFIKLWQSKKYTFGSLCESFDISRTTGYNLINKYELIGNECFNIQSKIPNNIPHKTPLKIEDSIIKLRNKYPLWGARKIKKLLERDYCENEIPSETTISAILKRNGLITKRRRRKTKEGKLNPVFDPKQCNEIWSSDYKGKFKIGNGRYCNPLTICDSKSRKILGITCHYHATYKSVRQAYTKAFRKYGQPQYMHTDNGSPFGSIQAIRRFSKLCYWLIDHDILPVFSDPGCPQQNGRHERMHKDLKAFCKTRIENTLSKQQLVMNDFTKEYNQIRPHEALNMATPKSVHMYSKKVYKEKIKEYRYPIEFKVQKVTKSGAMRWGAYHWVFISSATIGKYLGVLEIGNGIFNVYYRHVLLGSFDEKQFVKKQQYVNLTRIKV